MNDELLTAPEVARMAGRTPMTIRRWRAAGLFPQPLKPTATSALWRRSDVEAALARIGPRRQGVKLAPRGTP